MEKHPEWPRHIISFTGWSRVEAGTLTLDECDPLPPQTLTNVTSLAEDPDPETLFDRDPRYVDLMRRRGIRRYYGGIARYGDRSYSVIVSQQDSPAVGHRLEVYADVKLRDELRIKTGDVALVEVYHKDDWQRLRQGVAQE